MALSSILSIGLHLTIFLFFYYGLPFSKIKDRKETTIPLIFEEDLEVSNKTNLKKNEKIIKPQKKKQINNTIKNSPKPKPKPKKIISEKIDKNFEKLPLKPIVKPKKRIKKSVEKNIDKKPLKRPGEKIKINNRSSSSQAILRNLAEANLINNKKDIKNKKDIVNQIKESLKYQNLNETLEKKATATEIAILRNHVRQCWNAPYSANELNKIINLKIFTNPDGSVVNVEILDAAFYKKDPIYRAAADSARRAVKDCSPLPLPKNKYDLFKIFTFNFDTSFINR